MKRKQKSNVRVTVIGGMKSVVELEPAPPEFANYLSSLRVFDDLKERSQKAISDFYFYVKMQLTWVASFDESAESSLSKGWRPPRHLTPAEREKLRSITVRLSKLIDMIDSEDVKDSNLLLEAQSKLKLFQELPPYQKVKPFTGNVYLRQSGCDWLVHPPAVAYAFFLLLRKHGRPRLSKHQANERIARLHESLFGINIETDSVKKMVSRFSSHRDAGRIKRFLVKVENLPPLRGTK